MGYDGKGQYPIKKVEDINKKWGKPLAIKGVMSVEDAKKAIDIGNYYTNYSLAKKLLNWSPKTSFKELVKIMIEEDLKLAKQEKLLLEEGLLKPTWEHSKF